MGRNRSRKLGSLFVVMARMMAVLPTPATWATAPDAGGDTTVVHPVGEGAVSITEDAVQPESANIRLIVPVLSDPAGGTPSSIRIISVTGGTLWQSGGASITLGAAGTTLTLSSGKLDLRFRPDAGRDTNASFAYAVVDPHDGSVNSASSTATIPITAVNDAPVLQTLSGSTGIGLAATYYTANWDLTGATSRRIDATVNFSNNFNVSGMNNENFSVRWTGQVKAPVSGAYTFSTASDDGVRLWVDGNLIIDNWTLHGTTVDTASPVTLVADTLYDIRMEFYERGGGEVAQLRWSYPGQGTQIIPQASLFPAITRPAMSYVNGSQAVTIDDAVTLTDVDNANMTGATVTISANYQGGEDTLQFTNQNGITGSYVGGVLTLSGTATKAQYQTALRSVKYYNSAGTPTSSTRTIEFVANDGASDSNSTYRDIGFTATNTAPVITEGASTSVTMSEDGSPTAFSLTLNATDADYHSITWSVSSQASNGTATASGTGDSISVSYSPTANYNGSDSFVVQASDGAGGTDTITVNVTITAVDPVVTTFTPLDNATSVSATTNLTLVFGATINIGTGNILIKKTSDDSTVESISVAGAQVTKSSATTVVIDPSVTLSDGTGYYITIPATAFKDVTDDFYPGISTATTWNFTTGDSTAPMQSSITVTGITDSAATVTWTTNENGSTKVSYGLTNARGTDSSETDTAPRVTSHSKALSGLLPCTTYHYVVVSTDGFANTATSSDATFTTTGCEAEGVPTSTSSQSVTAASGGTTTLASGTTTLTVTAPQNFTDEAGSVVIQVKAIAGADILDELGRPVPLPQAVGTIVFDVKAIINGTTVLDSFDAPVTITYQYSDNDVSGLDERTIRLYHYHGGSWRMLDRCAVDTSANSISCTTPNFSIFALFGTVSSGGGGGGVPSGIYPSTPTPAAATLRSGCMDSRAINYDPSVTSAKRGACRYAAQVPAATPTPSVAEPKGAAICASFPFARSLRFGSVGEDVRALQRFLNCSGFPLADSGPGSPGRETVYFVERTHAALVRFQEAHATEILKPLGLTRGTGIFGEFTRRFVQSTALSF